MINSTFDPCLFISKVEPFGLVGMQIDDTLIIAEQEFLDLEEEERKKASYLAKPIESLEDGKDLTFNGCVLSKQGPILIVTQKR
jgi:hypothetical protein